MKVLTIIFLALLFLIALFWMLLGAAFCVVWITRKVGGPYEFEQSNEEKKQ